MLSLVELHAGFEIGIYIPEVRCTRARHDMLRRSWQRARKQLADDCAIPPYTAIQSCCDLFKRSLLGKGTGPGQIVMKSEICLQV